MASQSIKLRKWSHLVAWASPFKDHEDKILNRITGSDYDVQKPYVDHSHCKYSALMTDLVPSCLLLVCPQLTSPIDPCIIL